MVKTICYGETREWTDRATAINFFGECACASEGAERERYMNIILALMCGETVATDEKS